MRVHIVSAPSLTSAQFDLAPQHLLERRDRPCSIWAPSLWGMSASTAYTALETLLLFQSLAKFGTEPASFNRISEHLRGNALVREANTFDTGRLTPDALRELYLGLVRDEEGSEDGSNGLVEAAGKNGQAGQAEQAKNPPSPASRKRKLPSPRPGPIQEAAYDVSQLSKLVDRLYARYKDYAVKGIREEEARYQHLRQDIDDIERGQWDERLRGQDTEPRVDSKTSILHRHIESLDVAPRPDEQRTPAVDRSSTKSPTKRETRSNAPQLQQLPSDSTSSIAGASATQPSNASPTGRALSPESEVTNESQHGVKIPVHGQVQAGSERTALREDLAKLPSVNAKDDNASPRKGVSEQRLSTPVPLLAGSDPAATTTSAPPAPKRQAESTGPGYLSGSADAASSNLSDVAGQQVGPRPASILQLQRADGQPPPLPVPPEPTQSNASFALLQQDTSGTKASTQVPGVPSHRQMQTPHGAHQLPPRQPIPQRQPGPPMIGTSQAATSQPAGSYASPYKQGPTFAEHPQTPVANVSGRRQPHRPPPVDTSASSTRWKQARNEAPSQTPGSPLRPPPSPLSDVGSPSVGGGRRDKAISLHKRVPKRQRDSSAENPPTDTAAQETPEVRRTGRTRTKATPATSTKRPRTGSNASSATHASTRARTRSQSIPPQPEESSTSAKIKPEPPATPADYAADADAGTGGDTTADEAARLPSTRGTGVRTRGRANTRTKGDEDTASIAPETPLAQPNSRYIINTPNFPRTTGPILNDITGHKYASLFSAPVKERDAPGYRDLIYQPQDLKSIKTAIAAGGRAVAAAAEGIDSPGPATPAKSAPAMLPPTPDVMPPKGIVNSAQFEKELMRMFANAVMFNLDPDRGFGPALPLAAAGGSTGEGGDEDVTAPDLAAEDEGSVVRDTRGMFEAVEKTISNWRAAERSL